MWRRQSCSRSNSLDGRRRVEKGRIRKGALGDVDQQAKSVGDILVERALQTEHNRFPNMVDLFGRGFALDAQERRAGCDELAEGGDQMQRAVGILGRLDHLVVLDVAEDSRGTRGNHRRIRLRFLAVARVLLVQQSPRILADQLDQGRDRNDRPM
jgi:hypothetical protein